MREHLPQSIEIVQFFATLGGGAIVAWVVWEVVAAPQQYIKQNATLGIVKRSAEWMTVTVDNLPLLFLFFAAMGSLAWTVFKTRFG